MFHVNTNKYQKNHNYYVDIKVLNYYLKPRTMIKLEVFVRPLTSPLFITFLLVKVLK